MKPRLDTPRGNEIGGPGCHIKTLYDITDERNQLLILNLGTQVESWPTNEAVFSEQKFVARLLLFFFSITVIPCKEVEC